MTVIITILLVCICFLELTIALECRAIKDKCSGYQPVKGSGEASNPPGKE